MGLQKLAESPVPLSKLSGLCSSGHKHLWVKELPYGTSPLAAWARSLPTGPQGHSRCSVPRTTPLLARTLAPRVLRAGGCSHSPGPQLLVGISLPVCFHPQRAHMSALHQDHPSTSALWCSLGYVSTPSVCHHGGSTLGALGVLSCPQAGFSLLQSPGASL